jgi:hypothetical protein
LGGQNVDRAVALAQEAVDRIDKMKGQPPPPQYAQSRWKEYLESTARVRTKLSRICEERQRTLASTLDGAAGAVCFSVSWQVHSTDCEELKWADQREVKAVLGGVSSEPVQRKEGNAIAKIQTRRRVDCSEM